MSIRLGLGAGSIGLGLGVPTTSPSVSLPWYRAGGAPEPYAAWQPIGAASLAASYLRLVGSGGYANLDPAVVGGVAPTFDTVTGWGISGTQYLMSGIIPTSDMSMAIRFSDGITIGDKYLAGAFASSGSHIEFWITSAAFGSVAFASGYRLISTSSNIAAGVLAIAGRTGYVNGVAAGTMATGGTLTYQIYIGGMNNKNIFYGGYTCKIAAVAFWDTSTGHATWVPAVMAAMALL